ncbi:MAG: alanine/glycine:cation symporter family protein [Gemmatimonadetes bacterium]|nr:alanine/glycine:cation symporter family protein [Gemmatimonadota bacterium]
MSSKKFCLFTVLLGLFMAGYAFAQGAASGESDGAIQIFIAALNEHLGAAANFLFSVFFFDFGLGLPLIVIVLTGGGIYYSFYFGWITFRGFRHSLNVIRGRYDHPDHPGEISHFKALTSALSATVGLGNIAGVAIAVSAGGPGAVFWMVVTAFFGMASKLASCTLAVMHRKIHPDGRVSGGPMYYLEHGLSGKGLRPLGRTFAVIFALLTIGGSLGGGNMFQANQTVEILGTVAEEFKTYKWVIGLFLASLVAIVIIGGIKRIGNVTSRIVPFMCGLYVLTSILIILSHITEVPALIANIIAQAFTPEAMYGGFLGVLVQGVRRAAFSNEAGLGSAAFAHAAAQTDEPAREGMVAMIGPFIDTVIICSMTALVCMITGAYQLAEFQGQSGSLVGAKMTAAAFDSFIPGARYVLAFAVMLFAYSTMISWSYYGERAWEYLFGLRSILAYRIIFVCFVFIGSVTALKNVLDFSDAMILGMAFPNIIGGIILSPQIKAVLKEYWGRYKAGELTVYK